MACCVFTAYVMNRLIRACEILDIKLIDIKYNDFDDDYYSDTVDSKSGSTATLSTVTVQGMTCAACVSTIETAISSLQGVQAVSVSLAMSKVNVLHVEDLAPLSVVVDAINARGYDAHAGERTTEENLEAVQHTQRLTQLKSSFRQAGALSSLLVLVSKLPSILPVFMEYAAVQTLMSALVGAWIQVVIASDIHLTAWKRGSVLQPDMDLLVSLSLILNLVMGCASWAVADYEQSSSYFMSGSLLTTVIIGGRCIRTLLEKQMATGLAALYSLQAKTALIQVLDHSDHDSGYGDSESAATNIRQLPALALRPGHEIIIPPSSIIPCDCYVVTGHGLIDQAVMTGESLPVRREPGDFLMSGCRNVGREFVAVVSSSQQDSALEQLISNITTATETRGNSGIVPNITVWFVQLILLIAMIAFASQMLGSIDTTLRQRLLIAGERMTAILASACPCALGLATPTALLSCISIAWNKGIILTGGAETVKSLSTLTHMVLDKTGTLTTGRLNVSGIHGALSNNHLMLVCAAEKYDAAVHPVAGAIFKWSLAGLDEKAKVQQNKLILAEYNSHAGKGVQCMIRDPTNDHTNMIHIGTANFLREYDIMIPLDGSAEVSENTIQVHVAIDRLHVACLMLQDTVRAEAADVLTTLRSDLSLELAMLTGDKATEAQRVSKVLGISVLSSAALPGSKKDFVENIQKRSSRNCVAMVGDGINDTPGLRTADVGILLSPGLSRSNRICVQAADVILTNPNLGGLFEAVQIAKTTQWQIKFNIAWALMYNLIAVSIAAGVLETWGVVVDSSTAGMLMAGSSISIVAFSLLSRSRLEGICYRRSKPSHSVT